MSVSKTTEFSLLHEHACNVDSWMDDAEAHEKKLARLLASARDMCETFAEFVSECDKILTDSRIISCVQKQITDSIVLYGLQEDFNVAMQACYDFARRELPFATIPARILANAGLENLNAFVELSDTYEKRVSELDNVYDEHRGDYLSSQYISAIHESRLAVIGNITENLSSGLVGKEINLNRAFEQLLYHVNTFRTPKDWNEEIFMNLFIEKFFEHLEKNEALSQDEERKIALSFGLRLAHDDVAQTIFLQKFLQLTNGHLSFLKTTHHFNAMEAMAEYAKEISEESGGSIERREIISYLRSALEYRLGIILTESYDNEEVVLKAA